MIPRNISFQRKQEWALLYQHQQKQFQQQQLHEQQKQRLRKLAFKQALDQQRYDKRSMSHDQKLQDMKYSQFMNMRARKQQQQEERKRIESNLRNKQILQSNNQLIQNRRKRPNNVQNNIYHIGMQNVQEIKRKNELNKRLLSEQLKYQQYQKTQIKQLDKIKQLEKDIINRQFQLNQQQKRLQQLGKYDKFKQNMEIYDIYNQVKNNKIHQKQVLQKKMIHEVMKQRQKIEQDRRKRQELQKIKKTADMKDSLLEQIQIHNKSKANKDNSVNYNNRMYEEFYKDKRPKFDRDEYLKTLNQQMQNHSIKKNSYKYMSDEEYKLNANYLERVLNKNQTEIRNDRSAFSIGNIDQVSKRKDDIYFHKIGTQMRRRLNYEELDRQRISRSSQSIDPNKRDQRRQNRSMKLTNPQNTQDLEMIRQKIDQIMANRQIARNKRQNY